MISAEWLDANESEPGYCRRIVEGVRHPGEPGRCLERAAWHGVVVIDGHRRGLVEACDRHAGELIDVSRIRF